MNKTIIKLVAISAFLLCCNAAYSKEVGQVLNKNGGLTILTDTSCPVSDEYLYGIATGTKVASMSFCWKLDKDEVILYLPLNKSTRIPISDFEKPSKDKSKDPKPFVVI